jgi:hypothetical protein
MRDTERKSVKTDGILIYDVGESYQRRTRTESMNSYLKFVLVALASILIGVPLWTFIIAPDEYSLTMFTDFGFWVTAAIGLAIMLFGFWLGKRTNLA